MAQTCHNTGLQDQRSSGVEINVTQTEWAHHYVEHIYWTNKNKKNGIGKQVKAPQAQTQRQVTFIYRS